MADDPTASAPSFPEGEPFPAPTSIDGPPEYRPPVQCAGCGLGCEHTVGVAIVALPISGHPWRVYYDQADCARKGGHAAVAVLMERERAEHLNGSVRCDPQANELPTWRVEQIEIQPADISFVFAGTPEEAQALMEASFTEERAAARMTDLPPGPSESAPAYRPVFPPGTPVVDKGTMQAFLDRLAIRERFEREGAQGVLDAIVEPYQILEEHVDAEE